MAASFTIDPRFNGPPDMGNGGYSCGRIASALGERVRIRLQRPIPLGRSLQVREVDDDPPGWQVLHGTEVIATAMPADVSVVVPPAPTYVEALAASRHYAGFSGHPYPTCFVCGPERARGDGLRIFAAAVPGRELAAAPWMPDLSLAGADGKVAPEFVWAALDCPGYFGAAPVGRPALLGEFAVHIDRLVHVDEPCVVIGWRLGAAGRKYLAGTALFDEDGELCAVGQATWIGLADDRR